MTITQTKKGFPLFRGALTVVALLGLSACAGSTEYYGYPRNMLGQNMAQLVLHREDAVGGAALTAPIYVNDLLVGKLGPDGRFTIQVPAGPVRVRSSASPVNFEAVSGKTYHAEVKLKMEVFRNMVLGVGEHNFEVTLSD